MISSAPYLQVVVVRAHTVAAREDPASSRGIAVSGEGLVAVGRGGCPSYCAQSEQPEKNVDHVMEPRHRQISRCLLASSRIPSLAVGTPRTRDLTAVRRRSRLGALGAGTNHCKGLLSFPPTCASILHWRDRPSVVLRYSRRLGSLGALHVSVSLHRLRFSHRRLTHHRS